MGACASVNKSGESSMRYRVGLAGSKTKKFFISSPTKEKRLNGDETTVGFSPKSPDFDTNDEVFFDSRAWLDSDCDDDFFSVNGDFIPSRGTTPIHQLSGASTPKLDTSLFLNSKPNSKPEPSPTGRKKLAELFSESLQSETEPDATNSNEETAGVNSKPDFDKTPSHQPVKSVNGTPYRSGASSVPSSETTPNRSTKTKKDRIWKTPNCCLPSLNSFGFDEGRQKMSPEILAA